MMLNVKLYIHRERTINKCSHCEDVMMHETLASALRMSKPRDLRLHRYKTNLQNLASLLVLKDAEMMPTMMPSDSS